VRILYELLLLLLAPLVALGLEWRARRQTGHGDPWAQRAGAVPRRTDRPLWLHAASVGEVQAALPLIRALQRAEPDLPLVITTFTAAGAARAQQALGDAVSVLPLPYDSSPCVAQFLTRTAPRALLIIETELWPNLLRACAARGIPVGLVSARLSEQTLGRYLRLGSLWGAGLTGLRGVLAQSQADAARYTALGVPAAQVRVLGNMKWDLDLRPELESEAAALRASLMPDRSVLVAGSTREGEEPLVLAAFRALRVDHPRLALVLAPRHPERANAVESECRAQGFAVVRRSSGAALGAADVLLVDGLGELLKFYALADLVFVGGSLRPHGGHNLLEPAALGRAMLTGPHHASAPAVLETLQRRDALRVVKDAAEFAAVAAPLLADASRRQALGDRAREVVAENRGALAAALAFSRDLARS
jgi:3-deoxy-D-manno-octulosonic-acid transferase